MIKPSQRQRQNTGASEAAPSLTLHRSLARGRARRSRLLICSGAALAASFVAWLLDLPFALHLASVGLGFAAGFAWPLERTEPWALGWIDERAGLAYRTALERPERPDEDAYGFVRALSAQVERTTKRLEPPAAQPWWLPLLAVALSLAVLPALSLPGGLGGGLGGDNAPLSPNEGAPPAAQSDADEGADGGADEAETPEAPAAEDAAQDAQPELERTFDAPGEDVSGEGGEMDAEGSADSETLERYLESLEAQEDGAQPSGAERNPFSRDEAQGEGGAAPNQGSQAPNEGQRDQSAQDQQGEQGEGQQGQGEQGQQGEQGEQGEGAQDGQEEGASGEGAPEQTQSPREGEQQEGGSEGTPSEQEQSAEGEQPQGAQGESEGQQEGQQEEGAGESGQSEGDPTQGESAQGGSAGAQEGEQEGGAQNVPEGEDANGSGSLPSEAAPSSAERLEGTPQTGPELLEGQRSEGAVNAAGETLAPGSREVDIPNAQTSAEYERAAEEAINEGRIPVEYQDILRDYFR